MVRVVKGGRELFVESNRVTEYLKSGYSVIDDKGNVISAGEPLDYDAAIAEVHALRTKVKMLESTIADLESATTRKRKKVSADE